MSEFREHKAQAWWSYNRFAQLVRREYRHVMDQEQTEFLEFIRATHARRKVPLKEGTKLWRAVLDHQSEEVDRRGAVILGFTEIPHAAEPKRMLPLADRAIEGRVNCKGIPCLYCSDDPRISMSEIRPWNGSLVSLGELRVARDLTLVDMDLHTQPVRSFTTLTDAYDEEETWGMISEAFSKPVTRADDTADYAPTQIIAEALRSVGCEGIVYGSKFGREGRNYALFDIQSAPLVSRQLFKVDRIDFSFQPLGPVLV